MLRNPLVTVLMPVYNGGAYLKLSIKSILTQTYKDFEFLIINDASTDNSLEVIASFKDPRIVVHTNQVNLGQTKSLNVGLKLAKGKYIIINDADDLSLSQRVENQLRFISRHPEYAVVGSSAFIMNRAGRIERAFLKPILPEEITLSILNETPLIHGSVIMNKEAILAIGGYDENFRICQDYALWSSLIRKRVKIANMPDIYVVIRHYVESVSFKEKDAQTLENGKIIYENVKGLTSLEISNEDAVRQRLFFAAPQELSEERFGEAEQTFIKEYSNLISEFNAGNNFVSKSLKKSLIKPYSKGAVHFMKIGQCKKARQKARLFLKNYGFSSMPFTLWLLAHCGTNFSVIALKHFEKLQRFSTKIKCRKSLLTIHYT